MPRYYNDDILLELNKLDDKELKIISGDKKAAGYFLTHHCYKYFSFIKNQRLFHIEVEGLYLLDKDWKILKGFRFESKLETWINLVASRYLEKSMVEELIEKELEFVTNTITEIPVLYSIS